jgi:enoyl-CoA hydratase
VSDELITRIEGRAGVISLNKPETLHALTVDMVRAMRAILGEWASNDAVQVVILDHALPADGDPKKSRGFCAGGDIRFLREALVEGDPDRAYKFYYDEYQLNHQMFTYPKPIISFWDGFVMGGGAGIALPPKFRVVTDNTRFAMPETGIGLFPDVGGGWYLPRLPGRVGVFLGLTGARFDGAACLEVGLATHYLPVDRLPETKRQIALHPDKAEAILDSFSQGERPAARIVASINMINRLFASDKLEDIYAALEADGGDWALKELATLRTKSPLSNKVALRQLADGAKCESFEDNMRMEYRIVRRILTLHDFTEGVRAVIVDKDNAPVWSPATPDLISDEMIDAIFAPLPAMEEWNPL